ncbi:hypothetical protein FGK63_12710 [Ruegeria sediminis]|uniref:Uncharacterized protein n=1 Tax=Ruegeria sediminis TaxID=2583820 RepID=A0ABY2WW41_9RHOB|nr:hypothetical protein [Ruegeria sediminis]TMV06972.1 hypothetical protein FGK63_12710 [Ruegeria sediminis]
MTLDDIAQIIAHDHAGAWWGLFRSDGNGHRFLPTGHVLTHAAYDEIRARFGPTPSGEKPELTPEQIKRNKLRGIADAAGEGRRYGR